MKEINLKKTTKNELYTMLLDSEAKIELIRTQFEDLGISYCELEIENQKRVDKLNEELAAAEKEKNAFKDLAEKQNELLKENANAMEEYVAAMDWVRTHPWKHLWWCLWKKNHEAR